MLNVGWQVKIIPGITGGKSTELQVAKCIPIFGSLRGNAMFK